MGDLKLVDEQIDLQVVYFKCVKYCVQHDNYNIVVTSCVIWALRRLPVKTVDIHVYTSDCCIYK